MKCRHYYDFGEELRIKYGGRGTKLDQKCQEFVRSSSSLPAFAIEKTIEAYEDNCRQETGYLEMAKIIGCILKTSGMKHLVSLGVGKGILEWHLKQLLPYLRTDCTDYTPEALKQLTKVFADHDRVYFFDMMKSDYSLLAEYDCCIMYRISTELDPSQWRTVFQNLYQKQIKNIIFVPTELAGTGEMIKETMIHVLRRIKGRRDTFCGWLYTENEYFRFWKGRYRVKQRIRHGKMVVYVLQLKKTYGQPADDFTG